MRMYRPIADILLAAKHMETLANGFIEDPNMLDCKAEYLVVRMTNEDSFPEGPVSLPELRATIESAIHSVLGAALA